MVTLNLFHHKAVHIKGHDRYLIYRMIGRRVEFASPYRKARLAVSGVVEDVSRNIFDNEVDIQLKGGRVFRFKEPTAIVRDGENVVFLYGDVGHKEVSDEAVFKEMRRTQYGETVNEVLRRTEKKTKVRATTFVVMEEVTRRRIRAT